MNARWLILAAALGLSAEQCNAQSLFDARNAAVVKAGEGEFPLTAEQGTVLVKVASFTGDGSADSANKLAHFLRQNQKVEAFTFKYQAKDELHDKDREDYVKKFEERFQRKPRLPKLRTPPKENWVVMVGGFLSLDDHKAKVTLEKVRKIDPALLPKDLLQRMLEEGTARQNRAFSGAMLVPNPLVPPGNVNANGVAVAKIDRKTAKILIGLNDQEPNSIYKNTAPFTIRVAEFRGASTVDAEKAGKIFGSLRSQRNVDEKKSTLQRAADNAAILTKQLRFMGFEAFVFHGEYASVVTVGGYRGAQDPRLNADVEKLREVRVGEFQNTKGNAVVKRANGQLELVPSEGLRLMPVPIRTPIRPRPEMIGN